VSTFDKMCFILVERQKANMLRRRYLARHHAADKQFRKLYITKTHPLKHPAAAELLKIQKDSHESYRRIADLMNDQRPLLRQLRKDGGCRAIYNGANNCIELYHNNKKYDWKEITQIANTYVFESLVLKESRVDNPYAKELYGKEAKKEEVQGDDVTNNE
jgi:hypothetical protein